jgi:diguanylate cyclase (GGDEF)-like protein/PAS domain S-box-containing protein
MVSKTTSRLIAENEGLRARLTELEGPAPAPQSSNETGQPKNKPSKHKAGDLALRESESRYRRLFETAKDGILILDADTGRITDVNPYLEDMLGYSHTELVGKALWEIGPVKDITASQDAMRHLQTKEYIRYDDLPLETKSGLRIQVECVSNVYLVDGWRVIQCNVRDITARKRAEAGAQAANNELLTLVTELQRRDKEMQVLNRMNELLQSCSNEAEAYQVVALMAAELFVGQSGCLAILHSWDQQLETVARWGNAMTVLPVFSMADCWALRRGQLHEVGDPHAGLVCRHFEQPPQTAYLCLPLTVQGEILGLLCLVELAAPPSKRQFSWQPLAVTVGEAIKLSLSNLRLHEELRKQAIHDLLTGLFNRRYLEDSLARELYRAQRQRTSLCIVMMDLDHFKDFNDSFGHGIGDALLREFGQLLREHLRKSDIACRYGGEEFVLILPDSSLEDTRRRVEQIQMLLQDLRVRSGEELLAPITLSAGVVAAHNYGFAAGDLIRAADEALYAAKQAGRNCVVVYPVNTPPSNP